MKMLHSIFSIKMFPTDDYFHHSVEQNARIPWRISIFTLNPTTKFLYVIANCEKLELIKMFPASFDALFQFKIMSKIPFREKKPRIELLKRIRSKLGELESENNGHKRKFQFGSFSISKHL